MNSYPKGEQRDAYYPPQNQSIKTPEKYVINHLTLLSSIAKS
jgi:hypothetical protein